MLLAYHGRGSITTVHDVIYNLTARAVAREAGDRSDVDMRLLRNTA
jgi:hypothetical protein